MLLAPKTGLVLLGFLLSGFCLLAQTDSASTKSNPIQPKEYLPVSIGYYGNLAVHPGFKLGMDYNLFMIEKTKDKKRKTKIIRKLLYVQPNLSYYVHPKSHSAFQFNLEAGWRRYNTKLYYTEVAIAAGYLRKFNRGETYITDANGNVTSTKKGTSRGYFSPTLSFGGGKIFQINTFSFSLFTRLNAHLITGYNSGTVVDASWELGTRLTPNFGFKNKRLKVNEK